MFEDRNDAGDRVAALLAERGVEAEIVLAVPRGGLPIGRAVADRLGVPLDIVSARKIGAPWNPELAIGAVASDGSVWLNEELIADAGIDDEYVAERREREREAAREKVDRYRGDRPPLELAGKRVVVVDDGVATGATMHACLRQIAAADADRIVLAVPVAPPDTLARLAAEVDDVVCVETPSSFGAVGQFYRIFDQVTDEQARSYLTTDGH
ncbi:phosphoribosyltransferase [Halobaculum magnesiiphilum]|uniref:Phosphoribosyltransferase n=1 Tax=Halobaculum magnesiiphilum TaxID=1017351 RepID=A0A8T8WIU6_9EURY|nr:phosphoribosyltransferase family protein [Halobaculum magnesiiphilum]QZP39747.1 phosphoribosyltransferase [Halobaculum magnesiiphilum]